MSTRDPRIRLEHILESIEVIESYLPDNTDADLDRVPMLRDAVERRLEIIGEAVTVLRRESPEVLQREADVPWAAIAGLRVVLAHAYEKVQPSRLWEVVRKDLAPLKAAVQRLLLT